MAIGVAGCGLSQECRVREVKQPERAAVVMYRLRLSSVLFLRRNFLLGTFVSKRITRRVPLVLLNKPQLHFFHEAYLASASKVIVGDSDKLRWPVSEAAESKCSSVGRCC